MPQETVLYDGAYFQAHFFLLHSTEHEVSGLPYPGNSGQ